MRHKPHGSISFSLSIRRAAVREFSRTLCQWRHLPDPASGARDLPVSVPCGTGRLERKGEREVKKQEERSMRRSEGDEGKQIRQGRGWERREGGACDVSLSLSLLPRCAPGFLGETCKFPDPCQDAQLCQNGGSCQTLLPTPPGSSSSPSPLPPSFFCNCPTGFTGERCQVRLEDPCLPSFCSKRGRCHIQASGRPQCTCMPGWTGKFWWECCGGDPNSSGGGKMDLDPDRL